MSARRVPRRRGGGWRWPAVLPTALAMLLALGLPTAHATTTDEVVLQYAFDTVQTPPPPEGAPTDGYVVVGCQGSTCRLIHFTEAYEAELDAPTFSVPGDLIFSTEGRGGCDSPISPPYSVALSFTETGVSGTVESMRREVDCGDGSTIAAEPSSTTLQAGVLELGGCYFTATGCASAPAVTTDATDAPVGVVYEVTYERRTIADDGSVRVEGRSDGRIELACTGATCAPSGGFFFRTEAQPAAFAVPGAYEAQRPASGDLCGGEYAQASTTSYAFTATGVTGSVREEPMTSDCGGGTSSLFGNEVVIVESALVGGACWFTAAGCAEPVSTDPASSEGSGSAPAPAAAGGGAEEGSGVGAPGGAEGGTSSRLATGDPAAPSVLSALPAPAEAGIAPQQLAVAALLTVILVLLMSFPTSLLNSAIDGASDRFAAWRQQRGSGPPPAWSGTWWWAAIGVLAAAIISAFVDPQFGANPGSLRVLASIALGFAVDVVLGWVLLQWVMRRLAPEATRSFSFKPLSLVIVVAAVVFTRVTGFEPGIVFGLVAGLGFATTVGIAAKARSTLVPLAYAFGLGIVAWLLFGVVAERSGESLGMTLLVETLSSLAVGGIVALPLALVPVRGLSGHVVWQASRRLWAASYGIGLFAFFVVLMPMPFSWAEVGWELWAWVGVYVAYAAVAVGAWLIVKHPWRPDVTRAEPRPAAAPPSVEASADAPMTSALAPQPGEQP